MIMVAVLSVDSRDCHWRLLRAEEKVKTITDPLRGSTPCVHCYHQAARPCDCVGKTACMVFRIIRHLRCLPRL